MQVNDPQDAARLPSVGTFMPVATPAESEGMFVATSTDDCTAACENGVGIAGWTTLIVNAANTVSMCIACYQLHQFLIGPHPNDDAYGLAALAYLIYVPSLIDSILIMLFVGVILHCEYHKPVSCSCMEGEIIQVNKGSWYCLVLVCVVLFLLSCWPTGWAFFCLLSALQDPSQFWYTPALLVVFLWIAVSVSFFVFAVLLCCRLRPQSANGRVPVAEHADASIL